MNVLYEIFAGYQLPLILSLIYLDWAFGVLKAIAAKGFDGNKAAKFLQSQVRPCLVGYGLIHVAVRIALKYPKVMELLGDHVETTEKILLGIAVAAIAARLGKSIMNSIKQLAVALIATERKAKE